MWLRKYSSRKYREGEPGNEGGTNTGGQQGQQSETENNNQNNVNPFADLWQNKPDPKPAAQPNQNTTQPATAATDPNKIFKEHYDSLNIGAGVDLHKVTADIQNGGVQELGNFLDSFGQDIYKNTLTQASKLMDQKVSAAVQEALNKSTGTFNAELATRELNSALPFTKAPEVKPIADAVFAKFVDKGKSVEEAIKSTKAYFEHTFKLASKQLDTQPPGGQNNRFGSQSQSADEEEMPDWMDILGGKSSS